MARRRGGERHSNFDRYDNDPFDGHAYDERDDPGSHASTNLRAALNQPSASALTVRLLHPDYRHGLGGHDLRYRTCPWCREGLCAFHEDATDD